MKRILLALAGLMLAGGMAHAQTANVVSSCGSITYDNAGTAIPRPLTQGVNAQLCTSPSVGGPTTNSSSAITTGGTFQTIAAASSTRKSIEFQNKCSVIGACNATTDRCWLFFGSGTATAAISIVLEAGQDYLRASGEVPSDVIQATCTSDGDKFYLAVQ